MRLSLPLALALTLILSPSSAPAEDIAGTVRSYDQAARTLTLKPDGSTKEIRLLVPQGAIVRGNRRGRPPPLPEILPGTQVLVREQPVVAEMLVQDEIVGTIKSVDHEARKLVLWRHGDNTEVTFNINDQTQFRLSTGESAELSELEALTGVKVNSADGNALRITAQPRELPVVEEFWDNFRHNLFKPLLLFFYAGFLIPILRVKFEFPYVIYQGLTIYLLIAIGWHGGEELATLPARTLGQAVGFMVVGFLHQFFHRHRSPTWLSNALTRPREGSTRRPSRATTARTRPAPS